MILSRGGTNGEHLCGSSAFEERTGTSKDRNTTLQCRTGGVRNLEVRWSRAHAIGCGPEEDQPRTESEMGQAKRPGSGETQASSVSSGTEEDGSRAASEMGESEGSKEGGIRAGWPYPHLRPTKTSKPRGQWQSGQSGTTPEGGCPPRCDTA